MAFTETSDWRGLLRKPVNPVLMTRLPSWEERENAALKERRESEDRFFKDMEFDDMQLLFPGSLPHLRATQLQPPATSVRAQAAERDSSTFKQAVIKRLSSESSLARSGQLVASRNHRAVDISAIRDPRSDGVVPKWQQKSKTRPVIPGNQFKWSRQFSTEYRDSNTNDPKNKS